VTARKLTLDHARHLGKNTTRRRYRREDGAERSCAVADRVVERRRAVAVARDYREAEGLSTAQIADRRGPSPATIKAYFYDPTGARRRGW
jgi:DNA-binding NarL/FixJ family response regulator